MRVYANANLLANLSAVRAIAESVRSMAETATGKIDGKLIKFNRGPSSATFRVGGSIDWSGVIKNDSGTTSFIGIYMRDEKDLRLPAIDAADELSTLLSDAAANRRDVADPDKLDPTIQHLRTVLEAACMIAGLRTATINIGCPWGVTTGSALVHDSGSKPYRLRPDIETALLAAIPESCCAALYGKVEASSLHFEQTTIDYDFAPDPIATLRSIAACNLSEEDLVLKRHW